MKQLTGFAVIFFAIAWSAVAQAPQTWTANAKTAYGTCGEGVTVDVSEVPGRMHLKFLIFGKPYSEFDLALAPDGSGRAEFGAMTGLYIVEMAPGSGKRAMKTTQVNGNCQWDWTPQ